MITKRPVKRAFKGRLVGLPPETDATPVPSAPTTPVKRGRPALDVAARMTAKKEAQKRWRENQKVQDPDFLKRDAKRKEQENRERKWSGPKQRPRTKASWNEEAARAVQNMREAMQKNTKGRSLRRTPPPLRDHNPHDTTGLYMKDAPPGKGALIFRSGVKLEEIHKQKTGASILHLPSRMNLTADELQKRIDESAEALAEALPDDELQIHIDEEIADAKLRGDTEVVQVMEELSLAEWRYFLLKDVFEREELNREQGQENGGHRTKIPILMDRSETNYGEATPDMRNSGKTTFVGEESELYVNQNDRAIRYSVNRYTTTVQLGDQNFRFVYLNQREVENHIDNFILEHIEDAVSSDPTGFDEHGNVVTTDPMPMVCLDCGETIHHEFPAWASKRTRVAAPHFIEKHRKALVAHIRDFQPRAFLPQRPKRAGRANLSRKPQTVGKA